MFLSETMHDRRGDLSHVVTEQPDQSALCFSHTLINEGERDRHDFTITDLGWLAGGTELIGPGSWRAKIFVAPSTPVVDLNADLRPDTPVFLPRGGMVPIKICYRVPDVPEVAVGQTFSWSVLIRSAFDPTVQQTVTHTITLGSPALGGGLLYLDHNPALVGGRQFALKADVPTDTTLVDLDPSSGGSKDPDDLPGWLLRRGAIDAKNLTAWDWQYTGSGSVTLDGTATLDLWSSWAGGLDGDDATPTSLVYLAELQLLDSSLGLVSTLDSRTISYTHSAAGWQLTGTTFSFSPVSLAPNQYLRLRLGCPSASTQDCHIAYDADLGGGVGMSALRVGTS